MISYDKLVRDKIPEIIEASGKSCDVEIVSNEVALEYLYKKLNEEEKEYKKQLAREKRRAARAEAREAEENATV